MTVNLEIIRLYVLRPWLGCLCWRRFRLSLDLRAQAWITRHAAPALNRKSLDLPLETRGSYVVSIMQVQQSGRISCGVAGSFRWAQELGETRSLVVPKAVSLLRLRLSSVHRPSARIGIAGRRHIGKQTRNGAVV